MLMDRLGLLAVPHRSCLLRSRQIAPTPVLRVLATRQVFCPNLDDPGSWCGTPSTLGWVGSTVNQHCQPMAGGSALGAGGERSGGSRRHLGFLRPWGWRNSFIPAYGMLRQSVWRANVQWRRGAQTPLIRRSLGGRPHRHLSPSLSLPLEWKGFC